MQQEIKIEMISRRKALSLLGFAAALGFTLSSALEPLEAEDRRPRPPPRPLRPRGHMGCNGGKGGEAVGMSDATAVKSTATSDERVRNQPRPACRNSSSAVAVHLLSKACGSVNSELCMQRISDERDRRSKKDGGNESRAFQRAKIL